MCEAPSSEASSSESGTEGKLSAEEQRRQKRLAVGAVALFAGAVVGVVASSWPSACERAGRHLCEGMRSTDCGALIERIESHASAQQCTESMAQMRSIDTSAKGDARRYRYLRVAKTLLGD